MSEIEKMRRYVEHTALPIPDYYFMNMVEALELGQKAQEGGESLMEVISLAFRYGKAKGYRAAKAEVQV